MQWTHLERWASRRSWQLQMVTPSLMCDSAFVVPDPEHAPNPTLSFVTVLLSILIPSVLYSSAYFGSIWLVVIPASTLAPLGLGLSLNPFITCCLFWVVLFWFSVITCLLFIFLCFHFCFLVCQPKPATGTSWCLSLGRGMARPTSASLGEGCFPSCRL